VVAPDVVVILDGASEPLDGIRRTSLEQACTPALDALARAGELARVRTVPLGLPAGSEVAIPVLLGWTPAAGVDRGAIEAAAHGIDVPAGARAWRIDVVVDEGAGRADAATTGRAARALRTGAPGHAVHRLTGHRLLLVGRSPLPAAAHAPHLRVWPDGVAVPRTLDSGTVVVAARGAGAGVAALLGARVVVPRGATGDAATDLHAKAAAAAGALTAGARQVFVHVGGADEAAHARDAAGKVAFLERADRELIGPLAVAVERAGAALRVCPDHGCDPATGRHDARPVPCVTWTGEGVEAADEARRFTEGAVAALPVTDLTSSAPVAA
jgi:2,3-bisphosphoglycerate-independent phosphoglycerate mutase